MQLILLQPFVELVERALEHVDVELGDVRPDAEALDAAAARRTLRRGFWSGCGRRQRTARVWREPALERRPRMPFGSALTTHRCARFHAQQTWQRYAMASMRSACSTVPGIAP